MSYHEQSRKTFVAAGSIPQDALVRITDAGVVTCCAGENPIGITEVGVRVTGDPVAVRLINTPGTVEVVAAAPISAGQLLTSAEGGAVIPHGSAETPVVGVALCAATAQGIVEMLPMFTPPIVEA